MAANSEDEDFLLEEERQEKSNSLKSRHKYSKVLILSYSFCFISIALNIFQFLSQTKSSSFRIPELPTSRSQFGMLVSPTSSSVIRVGMTEEFHLADLPENELQIPWEQSSKYTNPNDTARDHLWDAINHDIGFIAVDKGWATLKGLPPSSSWPWNKSKSLYWIEAYHQLHCVKLLYQAFMDYRTHHKPRVLEHHIIHCLDKMYTEIRCNANDELIAVPGPNPPPITAVSQSRSCRNWDTLEEWAQAHTSCFRYGDSETVNAGRNHIDRMQYCPDGTPELERVRKYFGKGENWRPDEIPKWSWFDG